MSRPSTRRSRERFIAAAAGAAVAAALWFGPSLGRSVTGPDTGPEETLAASVTRPLPTGPGGGSALVPVPGAPGGYGGTGGNAGTGGDTGTGPTAGASGPPVPAVVFEAYRRAEGALATAATDCHLSWPLLAAIGHVESSHARGGRVDPTGRTIAPILGPVLNGGDGMAAIGDSEQGSLDGDAIWDRAVGPMQFIPTTWASSGSDGNSDGTADPHNVYDATLAAGGYLCSDGGDLATPEGRLAAVLRYNHSDEYARLVLGLAARYAGAPPPVIDGVIAVPETVRVAGRTSPGMPAPAVVAPVTAPGAASAAAAQANPAPVPVAAPVARPVPAPAAGGPVTAAPGTGPVIAAPGGGKPATGAPPSGGSATGPPPAAGGPKKPPTAETAAPAPGTTAPAPTTAAPAPTTAAPAPKPATTTTPPAAPTTGTPAPAATTGPGGVVLLPCTPTGPLPPLCIPVIPTP